MELCRKKILNKVEMWFDFTTDNGIIINVINGGISM